MKEFKTISNTKNVSKKSPGIDKDLDIFNDLNQQVEQAQSDCNTWKENHDKFHRLRIRYKKAKNFPFPGCSNLRFPTIEMYIRKTKANLVSLYSNIKPRMQVIPQSDNNLEKANRIERFMDWLADTKMKLLNKIILIADKMLEKGFCIAEVDWEMTEDTRTEILSLKELTMEETMWLFDINTTDEMISQALIEKLGVDMSETVQADNIEAVISTVEEIKQGKDNIKIKIKDELYNAPTVNVIDPADFFVNSDSGIDVNETRMCGYEFYKPYELLKQWADDGKIEKETVDNIDYVAQNDIKNSSVEITKDTREGIDRLKNPSHLIRLWKIFTYYDLDKDGIDEKCMFIVAPDFKQILKKTAIPYDHKKWPFVRFTTEIIDDRWFSPRGIPEHIEDISKEIDAQHNQKIDNQTIRNAPMFKYRTGVINPKLVKFIPGQAIPVPGMNALDDSIKIIDNHNPNVEFSYEREEMILKTTIQEYLGVVDYSLQSIINKRQPRTLGEVQMQAQAANQVFSLDSSMFTNSLSEMFTQILELCQQYMPERVFTLVTGENGIEPLHLTRDEIQGKYHIICRGNDINTNPQIKLQRALSNVQILLQPVALQSGVVGAQNIYNILKRYLQDSGELAWKEMLSVPQQTRQQPPVVEPKFDELAEGEQIQMLSRIGIKPDILNRALKSRAIVEDKERELAKGNGSR